MYLEFPASARTPPMQLKGFEKTEEIRPGYETEVVFSISSKDLSIWNDSIHSWEVVHGVFKVHVGAASDDIRVVGSFEV